jgi:hypothetical protein
MATVVEPYNLLQIQDRLKADTGKDFPPNGPNGLVADRIAPTTWDISDTTGTFSDAEIASAVSATVYDEDHGRDADEVWLRRQGLAQLTAIGQGSGGMTNAQQTAATRLMARVLMRIVRRKFTQPEDGHSPIDEP